MSPTSVSKVYTKEELCLMEPVPEACAIVIFGGAGDLAARKLYPSIFSLARERLLPKACYILGASRTRFDDAGFRALVLKSLEGKGSAEERDAFAARCRWATLGDEGPGGYLELKERLEALDAGFGVPSRRVFYLATPPSTYGPIVHALGEAGLAHPQEGWTRVVIEKPFGRDLATAEKLDRDIHRVFWEEQVYRIDHYLGKETVQNILMFRFANAIYEPVWNARYIDHVQITASEAVGVERRAATYEQSGAVRDMFQNHLLQLLCLVAMEPPAAFDACSMRDEKGKVLASLKPMREEDFDRVAVRGQYGSGRVEGRDMPGYRFSPGVDPASCTETYGAMRVELENWRWQGTPFYLRSGKALAKRVTEIVVQFKPVPVSIFKPLLAEQISPNILNFRIQPDEGITLRFEAKHPGPKLCMSGVTMDFNYAGAFGVEPPEAYARLLLDVMLGDQTLFSRKDWLDRSWAFLTPLLDRWRERKAEGLEAYPAGSWGPAAADELLGRDGRRWYSL